MTMSAVGGPVLRARETICYLEKLVVGGGLGKVLDVGSGLLELGGFGDHVGGR